MKYIKLFENIDWEEDWEEEDPDSLIPKVGDIYRREDVSRLLWWSRVMGVWNIYYLMENDDLLVTHVKHASEIDNDDEHKIEKGSIPYDGYMVKFKGKWPWFKSKDDSIKESKGISTEYYFNENNEIDWEEDWEEEDPFSDEDALKKDPQFYNFLKKRDLIDKYIYGVKNLSFPGSDKRKYRTIKDFIFNIPRKNYIYSAFFWYEADGGDDLWRGIHNDWDDIVHKVVESKEIDWKEDWEEEDPVPSYYPNDFKEFLIEHGALENFIENMAKSENTSFFTKYWNIIETYFIDTKKIYWGVSSFCWESSPQGKSYWKKLHDLWKERERQKGGRNKWYNY